MALRRPERYDVLLRVRRRQEDLRAQALAGALRDVRVAEGQREELMNDQRTTLDTAGERARDGVKAVDVEQYYRFERHLARRIVEKDSEIQALTQVAEERRGELVEAMKLRRMVEKLRERTEKAYVSHQTKQEQKAADELAVNYNTRLKRTGRVSTKSGIES